jgi:hypothetical protein
LNRQRAPCQKKGGSVRIKHRPIKISGRAIYGCLGKDETPTDILCDCEDKAYLRFCHLGQFFMEPNDYYDAPTNKVLHFIRSVGLIKG